VVLREKKGDSMRRLAVPANWPRLALGLAVPAVRVVAGGGSALAAPGLAAGTAGGGSGVTCTVHWIGRLTLPLGPFS
jgi:hypothetical protein